MIRSMFWQATSWPGLNRLVVERFFCISANSKTVDPLSNSLDNRHFFIAGRKLKRGRTTKDAPDGRPVTDPAVEVSNTPPN